ncbi:MAG: shikimate kinase [Ferruginibacter sp.]
MQKEFQLHNQPVFLLGFMGSGKTHWGKLWSQQLQLPFSDLDHLIEANEQLSVADIFEKKGEDYFREKEAAALRSIPLRNAFISCGGGTPCFLDNMDWMNQAGITVFLEASPRYLLNNILREPQVRPLLKNMNEAEMLFFIETKLQERNVFYKQAQLILPAEEAGPESLQQIITI